MTDPVIGADPTLPGRAIARVGVKERPLEEQLGRVVRAAAERAFR
jgi:hypothetical protein